MIVKDITEVLEDLAPLEYAEDFDNVGLLVGDYQSKVTGILVTLDCLEPVVDEAIAKSCNLIVSFHPIIFSGLKKLNGKNYVERAVMKAIKNNIAIYSMHTALDNSFNGVNAKICESLGIQNPQVLIPQPNTIKKLTTYVPQSAAEKLREALFKIGAGHLGNYSHCSFSVEGRGSFLAEENAKPTIGEIGKIHMESEVQLHVTFRKNLEGQVIKALFENHPYEEVAYEMVTLENPNQHIGMGMIGELEEELGETAFLKHLKRSMRTGLIKTSELLGKPVKKVAVLGGSGAFAIQAALSKNADIFITSDIKYHQFFMAEGKMVIADIGHYETEQFTKNLLVDYLTKKIPNFAVSLSEINTNPIKYF